MKRMFLMLVSFFLVAGATLYAQDQERKRDRIHQEDHLMLQDGKMYQVKQGIQTQLQTQLRLQNGSLVNPDGSYQLQNQEKYQLKNGQCLDMNGNQYLNQNRFNKNRMMTSRQIERMRTRTLQNNRLGNQDGRRRGGN